MTQLRRHGAIRRLARGLGLSGLIALCCVWRIEASNCAGTSVGFLPLNDLGTGLYQGHMGGLYPGGSNVRPTAHEHAGLLQTASIQPRNSSGAPDPNGKIVLLSIGLSNTTQEFTTFLPLANADPQKNPNLVIVDGAQGGIPVDEWVDPTCTCWSVVSSRLSSAGVQPTQVQAVWLKHAIANPTQAFPADATILQTYLADLARLLKQRFPNLLVAYNSSRIYAGYASVPLHPEPYAYQSGFAVKWLIEDQINGRNNLNFDPSKGVVTSPWLAWGPYLWADGMMPRSDGLTFACSDLQPDGTHPNTGARNKVANLLLNFFKTDSTTISWFLKGAPQAPQNVRVTVP